MNPSNEILDHLVSVTRDGKSFYELAATEVNHPDLKALFLRIAKVKGEIVSGLSSEIRAAGEAPSESGSWSASVTRGYAEVRALLGDKNHTYVAMLEDAEDKLMDAFDKALADSSTSAHAHDVITRLLPEVRSCHDQMRAQQLALKTAA